MISSQSIYRSFLKMNAIRVCCIIGYCCLALAYSYGLVDPLLGNLIIIGVGMTLFSSYQYGYLKSELSKKERVASIVQAMDLVIFIVATWLFIS